MPATARILKPLTDQLKGNPKPTAAVRWTTETQAAFVAAKPALAPAHPPFTWSRNSLLVDASAEHIGAALQKRPHPAAPWRPLGFFSRKLEATQVKYSAFDKELLACLSGFRHFRQCCGTGTVGTITF